MPNEQPVVNQNQTDSTQKQAFRVKRKTILIVVGVLMVLLLLGVFYQANYKSKNTGTSSQNQVILKIAGNTIPTEEFQNIYEYYATSNTGEEFNKQQTLDFIKSLYIENYILRSEYKTQGLNESDLSSAIEKAKSEQSDSGFLPELNILLAENTALKSLLLSKIGLQLRSGEVLELAILTGVSEAEKKQAEDFIKQKLNFYRIQLNSGVLYAQVKNAFLNDAEINGQTNVKSDTVTFTQMRPDLPIIPTQKFIDEVYAADVNQFSNIFTNDDNSLYGIAYITEAQNGKYTGYLEWLTDKQKSVPVEADFSRL